MTHVQMDPNYAQNTWRLLKGAIKEIHRQNASGLSFEELYRNAYNMVLHKYGDMLYNGLRDVVDEHLQSVAASIQTENFLHDLNRAWSAHKISMLMIRDILMYMDRVYVPHKGDCEAVYDMGLLLFRKNVARNPKIKERLLKTLLTEILKERQGEVINRGAIKSVTQMLVDVGIGSTSVYQQDFEESFLQVSAAFYRMEGQEFIACSSVPEYLRKVENRLREEINRVVHYLDPSTKPAITGVVEEELIFSHMEELVDNSDTGFVIMLREYQVEDLARMYSLLGRVEGGHQLMMQRLEAYIRESGVQIISSHLQLMNAAGSHSHSHKGGSRRSDTFVPPLLELKEKFNSLHRDAFKCDSSFQKTINQAFEAVINSSKHSPEFFSLYMDEKLKRGLRGVSEDEIEQVIEKAMELFRFISEKDVFERYYKQHLARRLLLGKSVSDYAERQLIAAVKAECGYQFTSKIEGMFQDMRTSYDTMLAFERHLKEQSLQQPIDLNVHVLTTGFWPIAQTSQCLLPEKVQQTCALFQNFYLNKHNGRRLSWQTNMGNADLKANFPSKRHVLNVSTHQMVILLLFNDNDNSLSYELIKTSTNIDDKDLRRNLLSLLRYKVLVKSPMESRKISAGDEFQVNANFKSKLHRIKLALGGSRAQKGTERRMNQQKISEDRKLAIQAAIIRVMKSRKTASHTQLVNEVTRQLSSRFPPDPLLIKKQVESLIERDYLERSAHDRKLYSYLA